MITNLILFFIQLFERKPNKAAGEENFTTYKASGKTYLLKTPKN